MKVIWYEKGTNAQKQVVYQSESKAADVQIAQLNNVLLIRDGDKIAKCMFDTVENKYKASISDLPALPLIKIDITDDFVKSKEGISGRLDIDSSQKSTIYENGVPVICNNQDYSISTAMNTFRDWTGLFSTGVGITGLYHYYITNASYKSETVETWKKMIAGKYKLLTEKKPKYYSGYVFLSYAFELFDGSITKPAPPRMFLLGDNYNKDMIWIYKIDCNEPGNSSWFSMLCYFNNHHVSAVENNIPENKLKVSQIKVKFSELDLKFDKDIIKSVIVYCSKPVNVYDFEKLELEYLHFVLGETMGGAGDDNNYDNGLPMGKTGYVYSGDEASGLSDNYKGRYSLALDKEFEKEGLIPTRFKENVINSVVLYKVEKFYTGESKDLERILDLSGIEANENITVDASGWYNTSGEMFVYNQRLHLFNYRQEFKFDYAIPYSWKYQINPPTFDWYIPPLFMSKYRHVLVYATVNVIIKTEAEYVNVIFIDLPTYVRTMRSTGEVVSFILPKYTAFPDMRAEKIDFYFRYVNSINSDVIFYHATQNLIPSKIMNVAYSANMNNDDMYSVLECIEINKDDIPTQSNLVYYNNTNIIVSELNNPFYFPVSQSYQAGAAAVQLAVAHEEITASQVGQFPLYVFTEERIFALEAGSGETLYSRVVPVSAEVCINKNVLQTKFGILFAAASGLKIISGRTIADISDVIEKNLDLNVRLQAGAVPSPYMQVLSNVTLVVLANNLSAAVFDEYMKEAVMGYDINNNEIIVSNSAYDYSYVYEISGRMWHKITEAFDMLTYGIGLTKADGNGKRNAVNLKEETDEEVDILVQTRPIKLDSYFFKLLRRIALRGEISPAKGRLFGFYSFGSNNLRNYRMTSAKQYGNYFGVLFTERVRQWHRYYVIMCAGKISRSSSISHFEIEGEEKINTRDR